MTRTSMKAEQDGLRARMRALGLGYDEIAAEFARRYRLRPRTAYRHAFGWTLKQAADQINTYTAGAGLDPDGKASMTGPHLCEYEQWPARSGRRPTPQVLALLAHAYNTGILDLLDLDDHEHLAAADRILLDKAPQAEPFRHGSAAPPLTFGTLLPSTRGSAPPDGGPRPDGSEQNYRDGDGDVEVLEGQVPEAGRLPHQAGELTEIEVRHRRLTASNVPASLLDHLEVFVHTCVGEYEATGPAVLLPHVVAQRRWVQQLLDGQQPPRQRLVLYRVAARLSALAGYMAVNRGQFPLARAYCAEAFDLALLAGDSDLAAWVRGTESLCEYYAGNPAKALEYALDGQRHASGGPQAIRLAVNGEARALGRLGDRDGVREAVGRAFELAGRFELPAGMSPCISFDAYSAARVAANAATAHVGTGEADLVRHYAEMASEAVQASTSTWSQALVALDVAAALVTGDTPEPEQAATVGLQALLLTQRNPIESVRQRGRDLVRRTTRWRSNAAVAELADLCRALTAGMHA